MHKYTDFARRGGLIATKQINEKAEEILGDEWSESMMINLSHSRTALRTLGIVLHPRYGYWLLAPDADAKLAALGNPDGRAIWREHMRITHGR